MTEDLAPTPGRIRLKITEPSGPITDEEVISVLIPTMDGPRLIIPGRAPLICAILTGPLTVTQPDGQTVTWLISDGVCEVRRDICAVLARAERADRIDRNLIAARLANAEKNLSLLAAPSSRTELLSRIAFDRFLLKTTDV